MRVYGKGLVKGLGVTIRHHLEKNITTQYPEEKPDLAPRFRGSLEYDMERCTACGVCVKACPNRVLDLQTFKGADGKRKVASYTIDLQYCLFCGLCTEACPTSCLFFSPRFELAVFRREDSKKIYSNPAAQEAAGAPAEGGTSEADAAIAKKEEMVKKLAQQISQLKKEIKDEALSEEERQAKADKMAKLTTALGKTTKELKELKATRDGGEG